MGDSEPERGPLTVAEVLGFIESLFPKKRFRNGVPLPRNVSAYWDRKHFGVVADIYQVLGALDLDHLPERDRRQLSIERDALQQALHAWQPDAPSGLQARFPARHVASIYHLLKQGATATAKRGLPRTVGAQIFGRWTTTREVGKGGQDTVYVALTPKEPLRALKVFRFDEGERGKEQRQRFRREVETLRSLDEPGILKVHDADEVAGWMVTDLLRGTLESPGECAPYQGKALATLEALRPVVKALATIHATGGVHRDICPKNIFVADDGALVLGDFGLFFNPQEERVTMPFERVGTRDYIAPWVDRRTRFEEWRPSADLYGLGKMFWYLATGGETLHHWYHDEPDNDLEQRFPEDLGMRVVNQILNQIVVERERDSLRSAVDLLHHIDEGIRVLRSGSTVLYEGEPRPCRVCGRGSYQPTFEGDTRVLAIPSNDPDRRGGQIDAVFFFRDGKGTGIAIKVYACDSCGHLEMFSYPGGVRPGGWKPVRTGRRGL